MGRPQNFVSRSLWMRSCRMYLVSAGGAIGGISRSSVSVTGPPDGSIRIAAGVLYRLPGARAHCCPSPRSIGSFTVKPSDRRKVSYLCSSACTV